MTTAAGLPVELVYTLLHACNDHDTVAGLTGPLADRLSTDPALIEPVIERLTSTTMQLVALLAGITAPDMATQEQRRAVMANVLEQSYGFAVFGDIAAAAAASTERDS